MTKIRDDAPLLGLKNIGPTIAAQLAAVGIRTVGDLRVVGPAHAHRRVATARRGQTTPVCYYLYSLQGALEGVHWDAVHPVKKGQLLRDAGLSPARPRSRRVPARG